MTTSPRPTAESKSEWRELRVPEDSPTSIGWLIDKILNPLLAGKTVEIDSLTHHKTGNLCHGFGDYLVESTHPDVTLITRVKEAVANLGFNLNVQPKLANGSFPSPVLQLSLR